MGEVVDECWNVPSGNDWHAMVGALADVDAAVDEAAENDELGDIDASRFEWVPVADDLGRATMVRE